MRALEIRIPGIHPVRPNGFQTRPPAGEVALYRIDREIEQGRDFFQSLIENVF